MKTNLKTMALIFSIFSLTVYSQWSICPGSSEVSNIGTDPVISVIDHNHAVICGGPFATPKIFMTSNGGLNFTDITGDITGPELKYIFAIDKDTIFVSDAGGNGGGTGYGKVWKTTNMGLNWNLIFTVAGNGGFIHSINFEEPSYKNGIIVSTTPGGTGARVYKSTDFGFSWNYQTLFPGVTPGGAGSAFILDSLTYGYGGQDDSKIYYTTNSGTNWNEFTIPLTGALIFIECTSGGNCIGSPGVSMPNIYKFNLGSSGQIINTGNGFIGAPVIKWVYGTNEIFISTRLSNNIIKRSTNGGMDWFDTNVPTAGTINWIDLKTYQNGIIGYGITRDNKVIKLDLVTGNASEPQTVISNEYSLIQNYPNPFNPVTNINYSIPKHGFVTLKIYDIMGKLISTLVNTEQLAGNYSVNFNADNLPSGIYYYTITSGDFTETKKMVLIK